MSFRNTLCWFNQAIDMTENVDWDVKHQINQIENILFRALGIDIVLAYRSSVETDVMSHLAAFHLSLCCLQNVSV